MPFTYFEEVKGQFERISSLLPCRSWGSNSGCHAWGQVPLPSAPSCWPIKNFREDLYLRIICVSIYVLMLPPSVIKPRFGSPFHNQNWHLLMPTDIKLNMLEVFISKWFSIWYYLNEDAQITFRLHWKFTWYIYEAECIIMHFTKFLSSWLRVLNENGPIGPCIWVLGLQLVELGRIKRCDFVGLGDGFELSKIHTIPRLFSLSPHCASCELLLFLLLCLCSTTMHSDPLQPSAWLKLFFYKLPRS